VGRYIQYSGTRLALDRSQREKGTRERKENGERKGRGDAVFVVILSNLYKDS
jgi:hypothetical protein